MTSTPTADPAATLAARIVAPFDDHEPAAWPAAALLIDHAWCVLAAGAEPAPGPEPLLADGVIERAARQAVQGQLIDLDDIHWATLVHPGDVVWPVVVQLGLGCAAPGSRWLEAALAGYAITVRHAAAFGSEHADRFHPTATTGTLGVVAAATRLLGYGAGETAVAIRHAWSMIGGSRGAISDPTARTRALHRAHAVRTGLAAVAAAPALPAAPAASVLATGLFPPGFVDRMEFGPIGPSELAATRPRLSPTTGQDARVLAAAPAARDPITAAGLAGKWGCAEEAAAAMIAEAAMALRGRAVPDWDRLVERFRTNA
jgi:hypothetical protein